MAQSPWWLGCMLDRLEINSRLAKGNFSPHWVPKLCCRSKGEANCSRRSVVWVRSAFTACKRTTLLLLFNNCVVCNNTNNTTTHQQIPIYNMTLLSKTKVINFYINNI